MTALLAVAVVVVTACGSGSEEGTTSSASAPAVAPTAPPTNVGWTSYAGMAIPHADQGPQAGQQSVSPTGYQHNGPGAALAAISSTIRMSVAPDGEWPQIAGALAAPGPGRDAWSLDRTQISITTDVPDRQAPVVLGYAVTEYTPERAVIAIITRQRDQSLTCTTTTVAWTPPGDWRRVLPDPGAAGGDNPVAALDGVPPQMISLPAAP